MTIKELKEELEFYEEDGEVIFEISDDVEVESWTENKWGMKSVHLNTKLRPGFICEIGGNCRIELWAGGDE